MVTGGRDVTRQEEPRLYNLLENLCISRGIPMPKLKVMEDTSLNAFASGMNEKQYAVTVTTGLINALDDAEIEAVLGHELTHIRNGDVRMLVIAVIIAGVISFFAEFFFRTFFYSRGGWGRSSSSDSDRGKGGAGFAIVIAIALIAVAWFLSVVIRFALSRKREFLADAGAVELTKNPDAMISALRKIENRGELHAATSAVMEMCVDNPREGFADLFATHPPVDSRVDALVRFAGGHDPGPLAVPQYDQIEEQPEQQDEEAQRSSSRCRTGRSVRRTRAARTRAASRSCRAVRRSSSARRRPRPAPRPIRDHGDRTVARARGSAFALVLAALCAACGTVSDPAAFAVAVQDKYDTLPCKEVTNQRINLVNREKELAELAAKAEVLARRLHRQLFGLPLRTRAGARPDRRREPLLAEKRMRSAEIANRVVPAVGAVIAASLRRSIR